MGKLSIKRLRDFPKTTKLVSDMTSYPVVLFSSPFLSHHTLIKDLIKKKKVRLPHEQYRHKCTGF